MYRSALIAPLSGFLLATTTVSHAASFSGSSVAVYPAEYGSSGVLTIAGSGVSLHGNGVVNWGSLSVWETGGIVRSGSGISVLSGASLNITGSVVLSTGSLSGFNDSLGTLTISPGSLLLFGNSSATDWGTWNHLSWTGAGTGGALWLGEDQLGLGSISFIDPNSFSSGSLSVVHLQTLNPGVTGWTLVPEPSGGMLAIAGGALLLTRRRRPRGTALPDGARSA